MIKIHVKLFATLRLDFGISDFHLEIIKPIDIKELIKLSSQYVGKDFSYKLYENDNILVGTIILINGKNIFHLDKLDTLIDKSCEVSIFPPAAGG